MARTDCNPDQLEFRALGCREVVANFKGGHLSSGGGGAVILREIESRTGRWRGRRLDGRFEDRRDPGHIGHEVPHLLAQRIHGLVLDRLPGRFSLPLVIDPG